MVAHCDRLVDEFIPSRGSEQAKFRTGGDLFRINSSSSRCPEDVINCRALPSSAAAHPLLCLHAIRVNINIMKELAEFINVGNLFVIIKMIFKFQFNPPQSPIPSWLAEIIPDTDYIMPFPFQFQYQTTLIRN